jgi:hypothetical protein
VLADTTLDEILTRHMDSTPAVLGNHLYTTGVSAAKWMRSTFTTSCTPLPLPPPPPPHATHSTHSYIHTLHERRWTTSATR